MHMELPTDNGAAPEIRVTTSIKEEQKEINHQAGKEKKGEKRKKKKKNQEQRPPDSKLRGWTGSGWYNESDFTGFPEF